MRRDEKLNALAGIASISAVVAMVLILSNLPVISSLITSIATQLPAPAASVDETIGELAKVNVQPPSMLEGIALLAIAGFVALSISSTVAVSKIVR